MSEPFVVSVCLRCGYAAFPERLLCPRCGGDRWERREAREGVVESQTRLHRAPGRDYRPPLTLALVRLPSGPLVVARLDGEVPTGRMVTLSVEGGAPVGRSGGLPGRFQAATTRS